MTLNIEDIEEGLIEKYGEAEYLNWLEERFTFHFVTAECPLCHKKIDEESDLTVTTNVNGNEVLLCLDCNLDDQIKFIKEHLADYDIDEGDE